MEMETKTKICTSGLGKTKNKTAFLHTYIPRGRGAITFGLAFAAMDGDVLLVVTDVVVATVDFFSGTDFLLLQLAKIVSSKLTNNGTKFCLCIKNSCFYHYKIYLNTSTQFLCYQPSFLKSLWVTLGLSKDKLSGETKQVLHRSDVLRVARPTVSNQ